MATVFAAVLCVVQDGREGQEGLANKEMLQKNLRSPLKHSYE